VSLVSHKRRLQGHVQEGGVFTRVDLRSGQCFQSSWESVTFEDSQLSMVHFVNSRWISCHLVRTTLYGSNWNAASLRGLVIEDCDMEQASFAGAVLHDIHFRNCRMSYASFVGASLHDVVFENCVLHGADLNYAAATGVQYSKCNLWSSVTSFGCTFWNSGFDIEACNRFAALLARVHPDPASKEILTKLAGSLTCKAVNRLMDEQPDPEPTF